MIKKQRFNSIDLKKKDDTGFTFPSLIKAKQETQEVEEAYSVQHSRKSSLRP